MKAKKQDLYSTNRVMLNEVIPLDTPFMLAIEPITYCNLKCNYCLYALPKDVMERSGHVFASMSMDIFNSMIDQLKKFSKPLKLVSFVGQGEPLMHKDLPLMIAQLTQNHLTRSVQIITNGTLLSHKLTDELIAAGVGSIRISINGLSTDDFLENCGAKIDFNNFLSELQYLYENRGNVEILIKTMSSVLKNRSRDEFFNIFGDYCDRISVENTMPYFSGISYENIIDQSSYTTSRFSSIKRKAKICSAPFYRMSMKYDGTVKVCGCRSGIIVDKDINNLYKAWNGPAHKEIMLKVLKEEYEGITDFCNECFTRNDFAFEEDNLDSHVDKVLSKIEDL